MSSLFMLELWGGSGGREGREAGSLNDLVV